MNLDDDMTLKQLLARCDDLEADVMIKVYFTPDTYWFYIRFSDVLPLFVPDNAYLIGEGAADMVAYTIARFIAAAVCRFVIPEQS